MNTDELLNKYFLEELNEEEQNEFNRLLESDEAFKRQFEFEKDLQAVVRDTERSTLKDKLKDLESELPPITGEATKKKWSPLKIAASIAALLALGWFLYDANFGLNPQKLYASNYERYPNTVYNITRGDQDNSTLREAFVAYEANDNTAAIRLFNELKQSTHPVYLDFYLAQAYLGNNEASMALPLLSKLATGKGEFADESLWYLGLTELKEGNKEKAIQAFEALIEKGTFKKVEATSLLSKLR